MCGIFGCSGKLDRGMITSLGCQNESRGEDSSGIAWIDQLKKKILVSKVVERGSVAFPALLAKDVERASQSTAMIGHTRMASTGKVNVENAHPFFIDNIVFAHNGIISNYKQFGKHDCDSVCLIGGIKDKNFEKFTGSIALVWIENNKLHAYRKGNPIYRGRKDSGLYLASEKSMLARLGCKKIKELTEGLIYIFDNDQIVSTVKVKENTNYFYTGSQEKFYNSYDLTKWTQEEEEKELKELGLDYYNKNGEKHYGKLDEEYEKITQLNNDYPTDKLHEMSDAEWAKYGGV